MTQTKRQKQETQRKLRIEDLYTFDSLSDSQDNAREAWAEGDNLVLSGSAGTGKTFTALLLALQDVLDKGTPWETIHIIRSVVPTREVGFLPGTEEEKLYPFTAPYISLCSDMFGFSGAYSQLVDQGVIKFHSTSFIRGITFDNAIIIVDEMQNLNFHELDSVVTRIGLDSRIIFAGDSYQSDFVKSSDKNGINEFIRIIELMSKFSIIEFEWKDIIRSDFVRDYIMTKEMIQSGKI